MFELMAPVYNFQCEIWCMKVDFEFLLWSIENGKTDGITNWSRLSERYSSNKLVIITITWMNTYTLFQLSMPQFFRWISNFSYYRFKAKDCEFKFVISFSRNDYKKVSSINIFSNFRNFLANIYLRIRKIWTMMQHSIIR